MEPVPVKPRFKVGDIVFINSKIKEFHDSTYYRVDPGDRAKIINIHIECDDWTDNISKTVLTLYPLQKNGHLNPNFELFEEFVSKTLAEALLHAL